MSDTDALPVRNVQLANRPARGSGTTTKKTQNSGTGNFPTATTTTTVRETRPVSMGTNNAETRLDGANEGEGESRSTALSDRDRSELLRIQRLVNLQKAREVKKFNADMRKKNQEQNVQLNNDVGVQSGGTGNVGSQSIQDDRGDNNPTVQADVHDNEPNGGDGDDRNVGDDSIIDDPGDGSSSNNVPGIDGSNSNQMAIRNDRKRPRDIDPRSHLPQKKRRITPSQPKQQNPESDTETGFFHDLLHSATDQVYNTFRIVLATGVASVIYVCFQSTKGLITTYSLNSSQQKELEKWMK